MTWTRSKCGSMLPFYPHNGYSHDDNGSRDQQDNDCRSTICGSCTAHSVTFQHLSDSVKLLDLIIVDHDCTACFFIKHFAYKCPLERTLLMFALTLTSIGGLMKLFGFNRNSFVVTKFFIERRSDGKAKEWHKVSCHDATRCRIVVGCRRDRYGCCRVRWRRDLGLWSNKSCTQQ